MELPPPCIACAHEKTRSCRLPLRRGVDLASSPGARPDPGRGKSDPTGGLDPATGTTGQVVRPPEIRSSGVGPGQEEAQEKDDTSSPAARNWTAGQLHISPPLVRMARPAAPFSTVVGVHIDVGDAVPPPVALLINRSTSGILALTAMEAHRRHRICLSPPRKSPRPPESPPPPTR